MRYRLLLKMQQLKLINDAVQIIAGKSTGNLAEILIGKRDVNEFLIAKKINLTINQTRNILYKLLEAGMVSFTRKKDKDKAWYTYFWTLDLLKSLQVLENVLKKEIENYKKQLTLRETRRFYICRNCGIEVSEETALLNDFTCTECGNVYELNEDKKILTEIQGNINRIEKNLAVVREEIAQLRIEEEAKKTKEIKKKENAKKRKKPGKKKPTKKKNSKKR